MRLLSFGICSRDRRPRLAQTESQLAEQTLALPHPQVGPILPLDPRRQGLSVPQIPAQARLSGHAPQNHIDLLELLFTQPPGPSRSVTFQQPSQTHLFKLMHPILNRPGCVSQPLPYLRACHALRHQQHAVESMVIA